MQSASSFWIARRMPLAYASRRTTGVVIEKLNLFKCSFESKQFAAQQIDLGVRFMDTLFKVINGTQKLLNGCKKPNNRY